MIRIIDAKQTIPIAHKVLWPDKPVAHVILPDNEIATHFGFFRNAVLVSVGSLYPDNGDVRLRKFATLPEVQGQGVGTQMLHHMIKHAFAGGADRLWCDARLSAIPFYERAGMRAYGPEFDKNGIPYRKMELLRI